MTGPARVAILGSTGCLGSAIGAAVRRRGSEVIGIARRPGDGVLALDLTRCEPAELAAVFAEHRIDVVVNAIACWDRSPDGAHHGNVVPVDCLLAALRSLDAPPRLVHIGTVHEYGSLAPGTPIREDTEPDPQTPYGTAKLTASRRILDAVRTGGLDAIVVRIANTYGPNPPSNGFLAALLGKLRDLDPRTGLDLTVVEAHRDYVDLRDAAEAVAMVTGDRAADPLVNIGRGEAVAVHTLVRSLADAAGLAPGTVREHAGSVDSLGGDWTCFDITRATGLLGWLPRYPLTDSMRDMWRNPPAQPVG